MRLKEIRRSFGYTQKQVAEAIGESEVNYNRYELGKVNIDIQKLIKIADFYDVSLDYLCDRQYNNNVGYIPDDRKDLVKKIIKLDEKSFEKTEGYVSALLDND